MKKYIVGLHACQAALSHQQVIRAYCLIGRNDQKLQEIQQKLKKQDIPCEFVDRNRLDQLASNNNHQGVVLEVEDSVAHSEEDLFTFISLNDLPKIILMLDGVQDPHNLGACLRSADAFGVTAIVAPKDNAVGLTSVVMKVACGAAETVPFIPITNFSRTIKKLQEIGFWVYGLSGAAEKSIYAADLTGNIVIIMGSEGRGMRHLTEQSCDMIYKIPMQGTVESLNVSVATGVVLAEAARQRHLKSV